MRNIMILLLLLCFTACSAKATKPQTQAKTAVPESKEVPSAAPAKKETREEELRRIVKEADPIIENILMAINKTDHSAYIRDFNEAMKSAYSDKSQWKKINKWRKSRIGEYTAKNVWKIQKQNQYYIIFYWVKFTKAQNPVTVRIVVEQEKGALKVAMLSFQAPELKE